MKTIRYLFYYKEYYILSLLVNNIVLLNLQVRNYRFIDNESRLAVPNIAAKIIDIGFASLYYDFTVVWKKNYCRG